MSRSWAVVAALLLATGAGCAGSSGGSGAARRRGSERRRRRRIPAARPAIAGDAGTGGRDGGHGGAAADIGRRPRAAAVRPASAGQSGAGGRFSAGERGRRRARRQQRRRARRQRRQPGAAGAGAAGASGGAGGLGTGGITVPAGYKLVWSDEFDVDGRPNSANWTLRAAASSATKRLSGTSRTTRRCQGGLLIIEARREQKANPNYQAGSTDWKRNRQYAEYTSSSLITSGLHSWQFGRFEMRGRIDTRAGMWPAWWTLGNSGEWPSNGEIDIMEFYSGSVLANVACGTSTALPGQVGLGQQGDLVVQRFAVVVEVPRLAHGLGRHEDRSLPGRRPDEHDATSPTC